MSETIKDPLSKGFTKIPHDLYGAICRTDLTGSELCVLMFVIRMTHGFHQESCQLSVPFIAKNVSRSERTVKRSLKSLEEKGIIFAQAAYSNTPKVFSVNPDIEQWCSAISDTTGTGLTGHDCHHYGDEPDTRAVTELTPIKENNKNIKDSRRVLPPTLEEIQEFCDEQDYTFDAEKFYNTYQATGWKSRGSKITDWKALAAVWQKTERNDPDDDDDYELDCWGNPVLDRWGDPIKKRKRQTLNDRE